MMMMEEDDDEGRWIKMEMDPSSTSDPHEELEPKSELLGPSPLNRIGDMQWASGILMTFTEELLGESWTLD